MVLSNTFLVLWLDTLTTLKCGICVSNLAFIYCRLEYIKLGSPSDPTWSEFPQALTQMQGERRYITLFKSPFVDSSLSESENNTLRASSLLAVPPLSPEVQPLEGLQGTHLPEANLTQWASYVQDVALGMWRPPRAATDCPNQDIAGVLHRLENLTRVGFCHLCYTLGGHCGCSRTAPQAPPSHMEQALWAPPQPSYASMASSMMTIASTSMRGVSPTAGPPPGFPAIGAPTLMDVSLSYNPLAHAGVGRGLQPQSAPGSARPWAPGPIGLCQPWPLALHQLAAASGSHEAHPATPYQQAVHPPWQVRFASPVTKAEATASQSQSVAEDLMDFMPSGWKRDLIHMVGCFYAPQIAPLYTQQWHSNRDKFIQAMEECKSEWPDIKELAPLRYMHYVTKCFVDSTGHDLKGLGLHTKWIRA